LQVTFDSNNPPSVPTTPPVLFTNPVAGLSQLFFYSGDAAHSSSQYAASANGSTFLLGGIILKWGSQSCGRTTPITFVSPFPNNCWSVQITGTAGPPSPDLSVQSVSNTGFTISNFPTVIQNVYYLAIGN
jgi:hypothetical protein